MVYRMCAAQVKTKELKPPADIVEAIQNSEDGSTAPPEAEVCAACMWLACTSDMLQVCGSCNSRLRSTRCSSVYNAAAIACILVYVNAHCPMLHLLGRAAAPTCCTAEKRQICIIFSGDNILCMLNPLELQKRCVSETAIALLVPRHSMLLSNDYCPLALVSTCVADSICSALPIKKLVSLSHTDCHIAVVTFSHTSLQST
jgi:hypothetical protein